MLYKGHFIKSFIVVTLKLFFSSVVALYEKEFSLYQLPILGTEAPQFSTSSTISETILKRKFIHSSS